jgi:hypothetical protein
MPLTHHVREDTVRVLLLVVVIHHIGLVPVLQVQNSTNATAKVLLILSIMLLFRSYSYCYLCYYKYTITASSAAAAAAAALSEPIMLAAAALGSQQMLRCIVQSSL